LKFPTEGTSVGRVGGLEVLLLVTGGGSDVVTGGGFDVVTGGLVGTVLLLVEGEAPPPAHVLAPVVQVWPGWHALQRLPMVH